MDPSTSNRSPKPIKKRNRSLHFIANKEARKASLKKRQPTLKLKAQQLATLCDVPVCLVCFGPDGKLETWPENSAEVREIVMNYNNNIDRDHGEGKGNENIDLLSFLEAKKRKLEEEKNEINGVESSWDQSLDELPEAELMNVVGGLDSTLQRLRERRNQLLMNNTNFTVLGCNDNVRGLQSFGAGSEKINNGGGSGNFVPSSEMFDYQSIGGSGNFFPGREMFEYQSMVTPLHEALPVVPNNQQMAITPLQEALPLSWWIPPHAAGN